MRLVCSSTNETWRIRMTSLIGDAVEADITEFISIHRLCLNLNDFTVGFLYNNDEGFGLTSGAVCLN